MGAGEARLQIHEPARGRAAGAVLVLRVTLPAVPVLPPDPLEVVHLEDEESDDPEENLRARHDLSRIVTRTFMGNGPIGPSPGHSGPTSSGLMDNIEPP